MSKGADTRKMKLNPQQKKRQIDLESAYRLLITAYLRTASGGEDKGKKEVN